MDFRTVGTGKAERCMCVSSSRKAVHVNLDTCHLTPQSLRKDATDRGCYDQVYGLGRSLEGSLETQCKDPREILPLTELAECS